MFQLFESLRHIIKPQTYVIDNQIYQLHYKATVLILLAFSLMVTARQYFGDPIECMGGPAVPQKMLDTFCWVHTTFSVENAWKKKVGEEVVYPGVDNSKDAKEGRVYHAYYQWVCFVLFFQALGFYVPRFLWKMTEGGLTRNLVLGLNNPILNQEDKSGSLNLLSDYFYTNMHLHNTRFLIYTMTEVLNLLNVIIQMIAMDRFLGGQFSSYGIDVLRFTEWEDSVRYDPMIKVFPRLTKCLFFMFGHSGSIEKHDAMCILPINILNEKIYIFLWFWFYSLALLSALALIYRAMTIFFPSIRATVLHYHCRLARTKDIRKVLQNGSVGDWFLLDLLAKNMEPANFRDLMASLKDRFSRDTGRSDSFDDIKDQLLTLNRQMSMLQKR